MELKPDYKQIDISLLPQSWTVSNLGEMTTSVSSGKSKKRSNTGSFPVFGSTGIIGYTNAPDYTGDAILVARVGANAGKLNIASGAYGVTDNTIIIRLSKRCYLPFFWYQLERAGINSLVFGSGQPLITGTQLKALSLYVPEFEEQESIADVLGAADNLITSLDALITKKRDIKQAAMQQLLTGRTRLPGFSGDWINCSLSEVCTKIQDGTHFSPTLGGNEFLYITSRNIGYGRMDLRQTERISATEHAKIYSRCDARFGDLLLTKDGANTGNAAINPIREPISLLSSVAFLRFPMDRHDPSYFLYQLLSSDGQKQIKEQMSGNAITRLTLKKIKNLRFHVPELAEQAAIAKTLSDMDAEIAALDERRDKTHGLKQGMMQQLLNGRIRLL